MEDPSLGNTALDLGDLAGRELVGKPIRRVEVITVGGRWATRFTPADADAQPGRPTSPEVARRIMREALSTGRFARANVEAYAEGGEVVLRLNVLPRRLIASIQLTGSALDTAETLDAAEVSVGGELTFPLLARIEARVRGFYEQRGFPAAQVRVDATDTDHPDKVVLLVEIKPGAARTVSWRGFLVDPVIDRVTGIPRSNPLVEREVGDVLSDYKVSAGARVDQTAMAEADRELTNTLRQRGFFRAEVRHRLERQGRHTYLYVYVMAGPHFVPVFEGNHAFDASDLEPALNLEKAPEVRASELIERLRTFYVARGFFDVEVRLTERYRPDDPVHHLVFTIRENPQVRVKKRVFPCLTGEMSPDDVGREIGSFLEEDLPGFESPGVVNPQAISELFGPTSGAGGRGMPPDLNPLMTYAPETYDRALKHVRDLLHSKGYLNAVVGPISMLRTECSKRSPAGACIPLPPRASITPRCQKDPLGLPVPEPPVPDALQCRPDPAHDVACSPEVTLRIPIALGPQTTLYDLAFEGNRTKSGVELAKIANLALGTPLSNVELEAARLRVQDAYRLEGYAYADVRAEQEPSPDRTRVRVRFYITEREPVTVTGFVVKGATRTSEPLILGRVALKKDREFRQDWRRQSEERISTLGTFSSVSVALEDAQNPQKQKRVVITVVEQLPQYTEPRAGFSTGDGLRFTFEYGHRNLGGQAISMTLRAQLSYLPDALILDSAVLQNYSKLSVLQRLERRDTISLTFHEVGLGPLFSLTLDAIDLNDNQRDFGLNKEALVPTLTFRPIRPITVQLGVSTELNNVNIFNDVTAATIYGLLRAPAGRTVAFAERLGFTADYRDTPFNATKGVIFSTSAEHVNALPLDDTAKETPVSHFLRLSGRLTGYLSKWGITLVTSLASGGNIQLSKGSATYPDRLFFLGGVDSIRAFLADALVPQDVADRIKTVTPALGNSALSGLPIGQRGPGLPLAQRALTIQDVALRGGDLSINPRVELRLPLPIFSPLQAGVFLDMANLWLDPTLLHLNSDFLRYGLGAGLRYPTPIGPVAVDYGFNLNRRAWEDVGAFHFSIGLF
jgi:outer membrane protein assembly factor BamA